MFAKVWKDLSELESAFSVFLELERAGHQGAGPTLADVNVTLAGQGLSRVFRQRRFGIKCIHMARTARHEKRDDGLCSRLEVRPFWGIGISAQRRVVATGVRFGREQSVFMQQVSQRQTAHAAARLK